MGYTNSPLVAYTKISPNRTKNRNHAIDTITIHCVVGQCSVETIGNVFAPESRQASSNYGVGVDGRIGMYCEEKDRSWCSSNAANDHRAITIEVASDTTHPYAVKDVVYNALIELVADICKRNGIKKLLWKADKSLIGQVDKQNMTVHRWFANKSCPGDYLYERHGDIANKVNALLGAAEAPAETPVTSGLQATTLKSLSNADAIKKVAPLFTADQKKSGILASVSLAQFILESGYGSSELAQNANNCFGMKKSLSGNTWAGSAWDGSSVYTKKTQEQNADGSYVTVTADFRKYSCVENSVADHSAYLLGAMNGSKKRYEGLAGEKDYKKAIQIIKDGGYATSLSYVTNVCNIIEKWNLTQYDAGAVQDTPQEGAGGSFPAVPFTVKVLISDLNYRSCGSMEGAVRGQTGKGVFTIVEVKDGWGRLKSGAGWIYLLNPSYCTVQGSTIAATSPAKSVTEIAKEVIAGKWGNGTDRKNRLQAAGYNYSEVQNKVNALLS
jgi:flagellum-specific peptidoglycan hydrolase FlgJ